MRSLRHECMLAVVSKEEEKKKMHKCCCYRCCKCFDFFPRSCLVPSSSLSPRLMYFRVCVKRSIDIFGTNTILQLVLSLCSKMCRQTLISKIETEVFVLLLLPASNDLIALKIRRSLLFGTSYIYCRFNSAVYQTRKQYTSED